MKVDMNPISIVDMSASTNTSITIITILVMHNVERR